MALQKLVILLAIILTSNGCHGSSVCGTAGSPGNWPWQATITQNGTYVCGGTLINEQWILTSSECIIALGQSAKGEVTVGSTTSGSYYNSSVSQPTGFTICPSHDNNDICLINLPNPVNFSAHIQPVCLAAQGSTFYSGVNSQIVGWASQIFGNYIWYSHYDFRTSIVGENECSCLRGAAVPNNTLCTAANYFSYTSNLQSLGTPLMVQQDSAWVQAGIFMGGCTGNEPCVFIDVSKHQVYIEEVMRSINHTLPGVVSFTSPGENSDLNYECTPTTTPPPMTTPDPHCYGLFCSGDKMTPHLSQLLSLCGLTLLLFVMG